MQQQVFVILFNARTENEGIHSLQVNGRNTILMFESEDDATRFGLMLEAQDFPPCSVEAFFTEEIEEFCKGAGYECKLIPEGMLAVPPEQNVEQTDWSLDQQSSGSGLPTEAADEAESAESIPQSELERIRRQLEGLL